MTPGERNIVKALIAVAWADGKLADNARALIGTLLKAKPAAAKGQYMQGVAVTTTMGPPVRIDPVDVRTSA